MINYINKKMESNNNSTNAKNNNTYKNCNIDINQNSSSGSIPNSESNSSKFRLIKKYEEVKLENTKLIKENTKLKEEKKELNLRNEQLEKEIQMYRDIIQNYNAEKNKEKNQVIEQSANDKNLIKPDNKDERLKEIIKEKDREIDKLKFVNKEALRELMKLRLQDLKNGDEHDQEILKNILKHNPNLRDDYVPEENNSESNEPDKEPEEESNMKFNKIDNCIHQKMESENNIEDMKTEDITQKAFNLGK